MLGRCLLIPTAVPTAPALGKCAGGNQTAKSSLVSSFWHRNILNEPAEFDPRRGMDTLAGDALGAGSVPANELRQVKQLLWTVIAEKLNPAEVDEVSLPNFYFHRHLE